MNDENEIERDQGSGIGDQGAGLVVPHASEADEVRQALLTSSVEEEGPTAAAAARKLQGYVYKAHALSQLPESEFKTEQERFAAAEAIARGMTGQDDPLGRLWNGGKGFETGGEYLRSVKETFMRGMQAAATPRLQQYLAADEDEKNRLASEAAPTLGKFANWMGDVYVSSGPLNEGEMASAPDDVREASEVLKSAMVDEDPEAKKAAEEKVLGWRRNGKHLMEYRAAYEEKLMRENALMFLPDVLKHLKGEDARKLCSEIIDHPERRPADYGERLKALDTGDIEIIGRINHMVTPRGEGGFWNTIGDAALAALSSVNGVLRGGAGQLYKGYAGLNNLGAELLTDEPEAWKIDYNAALRRRTALWAAGEGLGADINQISEDHGMVASGLIGIAGVLPVLPMFNSAAGLGTLTVESMAQMDERMVREGVDVTDPKYVAGSMLAAGLQTYVMKRGFAKTFGAKMTEKEAIELQTAWLKGVMAGLSKMPTYRNLTAHTLGGAMAMGLSAGIGEINAAVAKNGIDADALAEGGKAFVEEFVGSIPDMAVFAASGMLKGHAERSGGFRRMFTDAGLATRDAGLKGVMERKYTWLSSQHVSKDLDRQRFETGAMWLAQAHRVYSSGGKDELAKTGLKAETVEELADFFEQERMLAGSRPTPAPEASEESRVKSEKSGGRRKGRGKQKDYYRAQVDERRRERDIENWNRQEEELGRKAGELMTRFFENRENAERLIDELEPIRNIWAKGGGMIETEIKDGKEITNDPGQAALIKAGFSEETAKEFSDIFREEQRRRCSHAAFNGIQAIYERSTRGMTTARGQLDSVLPKGRITERDGRAFVNFTKPTGESVDAEIARGAAEFTLENVSGAGGDNMAGQVEERTKGNVKAADWKEMTPEERLETVKRYNLVQAGNFVLTDPHDPSITVDTDGARRIVGRIETPAVGGKPFHEVAHGYFRFMQESGFWNEADIKWLRETFGEPRAKNEFFDKDGKKVRRDELFNEEAACDAVQAYAAKKLSGSLTDEPPALRKLWTFARRMVHLTEKRVAEEKLAADREQALYDAILTGTFSHIADLKVAEKPVAPKPSEGGEGAAAPQTGTLPKESGRFKTVTKTQESVTKTGTEAAKPDEGAAKSEVKPEVTFEALTPTGGKKIRGHYEFVPLAKLLHSNKPGYPMELQGRDRKDNKAEQQTRNDHVANFEAGYLLADPKTDSGAMVVVKRPAEGGGVEYVVVSGNGRTMVLEDLVAKNLYDKYRNPAKAFAAENGIENGVPDGENPVLVRVIDDLGGATLKEIADLSNTNAIQQMNEEEQARADADTILKLDIARLYAANADGSPNMTPGANADFFREFVKGIGDTGMLNSDGSVTEALRLRAQRALLAIACGQGEHGRETVKALVEQAATLGIERQKEAAAAMAPHVAAAEARPEFAIGPDVSRAFADFLDFMRNRDTGKKWGTVEEYLKQGDMLDPRSEIAESILRMLGERKSPGYVAEVARVYAEAAKGEQDGLFGAARKPAEIWREAEKAVAEDGGKRWSIVKIGESDVAVAETEPLTTKEANDEKKVRAILDAVVGNEYRQLGEAKLVKVSPAFPDEFWKSNDSERLRRKHEKLWRAKVSAVPVLGEIIGNTKLGPAEAARHINRDFKERATFYRCETKFGIKRWNGVAVYPCDLLLFELDGRRFVYDILNVRKPTLTAAENLGEETRRRLYDGGTLAGESVANARSIAQSGAGGNGPTELADKVRRIDPDAKRWAITKAAEVKPATEEEYADVIARFGETKDYGEAAWLFPDGRMPKPEMKRTRWGTMARNHDSIFYILNRGKLELGDMSGYIDTFAGGAMRLDLDNGGIEMTRKPSDVQMDAIYDICEAAYQKMEADDLDTFRVDISDDNGSTLFTLQYPRKTSARRIIDDIKNYYDSGWIPDNATGPEVERRGGTGAERRWSIATRLDEERQLIEERGGQLILAHHGTDSRGFTRFEKSDDLGYFFAKSRNTAASYIRNGRRGDEEKPGIPYYTDVLTYLKDEASGPMLREGYAIKLADGTFADGVYNQTWFDTKEGAQHRLDMMPDAKGATVVKANLWDDHEIYEGNPPYDLMVRAYVDGTGEGSGVYDVALKMEDPYVIDCHGAAWNAIYEIPDDTRSDTTTYDRVIIDYNSITGKFGFWRREYIEDRNDWVPGKEAGVDKAEFDDFESFRKHVIQEMGDTFAMDELEEIKRKAENDEDVSYEPVNGSQEKSEAGMMWAFDSASGEGWGVFPRNTREIVEDAANMGCDGVIFHNVVDNGGGIREADADDVYVVMKSEQVKSVDDMTYADDGSIIPTEKRLDWTNRDIRWSIGGVHGAMMAGRTGDFDSAWRMLERNYNPLYVWKKTGFWRGKDRGLRFEIPDGKMKDAETILKVLKDGENNAMLSEVMDAPELFKAYPDLARLKVHFNSDAVKNGEAHYSPAEDSIYVGFSGGLRPMSDHDKRKIEHWKRVIEDPERRRIHIGNSKALGLEVGTDEDVIRTAKEKIAEIEGGQLRTDRIWAGHTAGNHVRDILIHEIQHAIQQRERFAKGMSDHVARKYAQEILGSTNADDAWLTEARQNTEELIAAQAELKLRKYVRFGDVENAKPEEWSPEALKRLDRFTKDGSWQQYGDSWSTPRKSRSKKRQKLRHEQIIKAIKRMVDEEVMSRHPEYRDKTNAELEDVIREANKWSRDHFERVQDAKDKRELASKLATMSDYEIYLAFAGEVEARQAVARANMSDVERAEMPPWKSEDTPRSGQIVRWSVEVSPTLREDVTAALNTDRTKGEVVKGEKRVVFCDTPGLLRHIGVPQAKIYSKAYALRKIVTDHKVTAEQIAGAPELMNHPAAVFRDVGDKGFVVLTDANVPDANGELAPMMIYLRPDGEGNYLASAYSRTKDAEVQYLNLAKAGKTLYFDKSKVADLALRGEVLSSLSTFSIGDDVATPERITAESIAQSAADGNADKDPFFALGNQKRRREAERRDPEAVARQAIVALTQGGEEDKTSALVAFVAYRDLTGGAKPRAKTISTLGFQMGMKTVAVGKIVREGEGLAKRMRDTVIAEACERGDVATAMAMLARERMADAAAERIVSGAAQRGGYLKEKGEIAQKAIMEREISKLVRATNAATLEDMERDTGLDLASEILAADPDKFDPSKAQKKGEGGSAPDEQSSGDGGGDGADAPADVPFEELTDLQKARRKERQAAAEKRVAEMIEKAKARAEKKAANRKANADAAGRDLENQAAFDAENGGEGGGGAAAGAAEAEKPDLKTFADFKTKEEFAAFLRAWATDAFAKSIGIRELTKAGKHRLFAEFYRKTVIRELSDLADKLLPPKGARAWANRRLGEIEQGTAPDTIERISGDVFALINRNAIREERTALIQKFRNDVRRYYNGEEFDEFKQDTDRKLTGWIEESARYIHRVCNLAIKSINGEPSQIEQEREKLREIIDKRSEIHDESGKKTVDWAITDDKARRALAKLELLDRFGGMKELMPGEIADRTAEALEYLEKKAGELEKSWEETRRVTDGLIHDFAGGVIGPKGGMRYERGKGVGAWFDGLADALNGMIRLRLQHLTRFADPKAKEAADRAINSFVTMLGDGEVAYSRITDRDRKAFAKALHAIFRGDNARIEEWMNRMTENIPVELSRQISNQGFAEGMTYGQMFNLLVAIEQKSLRPNVEANGRDGQSRLIRDWIIDNPDGTRTRMFTSEDALFVDWLREFYKSTRAEASKVTERMNGMPIYSPDPLYCPVKMYMGDVKRDWHGDTGRWDPVGSVFARRVENLRDFDESASVLGMFFDRSAARAQLIAWAERGTILRNVFTDVGVRSAIERAFGKGEYSKIAKQIEQTMTGGEGAKKTPGEIAAADKAMNYITYASLGFNPLSAMKQTTSFPVWANAIGWTRLWHHMTHFDKAALKHLMESEEFKVRYGDQVNGGMDIATRGLNENPGRSRVAQMFQKWSMGLLKLGDFAPGGWIAQGVYKDFLDKHLKEGMEFDAADHLSITETFNLLEETQQSGRTYNTNELSREHGRIGRLLTQFATSPLQQLQYQMQAIREVRDLWRYRPAAKDAAWEKNFADAKAKLVRATVINHVLLPAALHAVTNFYKLAMGYDPEWEQDGWHQTLLRDLLLGQFSRVFYIGTMAQTTFDALFAGKRPTFLTLLPAEGAITQVANIAFTARDVFMGMDPDKMRKDIDRLLKSTSVTRTPYDLIWRATGRDMNQRKEFIRKGRMPK